MSAALFALAVAFAPRAQLRSLPSRAPSVQLLGPHGFGADGLSFERERARMAGRIAPNEPLPEELRGLAVIGGVVGALLIGGGPFGLFGILFGFNCAPLLAFVEGAAGDRIRTVGWVTDVRVQAAASSPQVRKAGARLADLDRKTGASDRARRLGLAAVDEAQALWARVLVWWRRSGLKKRCTALMLAAWRRSGLERRWKEHTDQQARART